ncbi:sigma-70 family RNA polymerase sigma factor [Leucobacter sp. UT-8R-CII-1-4]|uniref:RNA polymerase sigma factor n=1 Tax=Leucobacter sp. UT-8R-CII-1-4 TaxID=3040075 RepID=UPI0024A86727|nr:sigma-70 family RNA polymerase sigma factor [Leucobacter sp. UT-8R-CII-1-4]MDI6024043.1 sigma-70 family RNA polymerase sigma factor [Leucobacter sp. UT-8R-CII-1-4]
MALLSSISAPSSAPSTSRSDAALLCEVRAGSSEAWAELWRRHYSAALLTARRAMSRHEAEDLTSQTFIRVHETIMRGSGPVDTFRAYLLTAVRHAVYDFTRTHREVPFGFAEDLPETEQLSVAQFTEHPHSAVVQAFESLPERWRNVLWLCEVEELHGQELALRLGLQPNAVAALAFRARAGLRNAWVEYKLRERLICSPEHDWVAVAAVAFHRETLRGRAHTRLLAQAESCSSCALALHEARTLLERVRSSR